MLNTAGYEPVYIRASYERFNRFLISRQQTTGMVKRVK